MSLEQLNLIVIELPFALRDQVLGYARSVDDAFPDISRDLAVTGDERKIREKRNNLILLAGIKKLLGITSGSYWTLDNAASLLEESGIKDITIGGRSFARGSDIHASLYQVTRSLEITLEKFGFADLQRMNPKEILQRLVNDAD